MKYLFNPTRKKFAEHEAQANSPFCNGGHMASTLNATEHALLETVPYEPYGSPTNTWLGGKRTFQGSSVFEWLDGSTFGYTNWVPNSPVPDNINHEFILIYLCNCSVRFRWNDVAVEWSLGAYYIGPIETDASTCLN